MVVVCGRGGPWRREDPAAHGGRYLRHHGLGVQGGRFAWSAPDRGRGGCRVQLFTAQHGAVTTVGCAAAPPRQRRRGRVPDADYACRKSERINADTRGSQQPGTPMNCKRHRLRVDGGAMPLRVTWPHSPGFDYLAVHHQWRWTSPANPRRRPRRIGSRSLPAFSARSAAGEDDCAGPRGPWPG